MTNVAVRQSKHHHSNSPPMCVAEDGEMLVSEIRRFYRRIKLNRFMDFSCPWIRTGNFTLLAAGVGQRIVRFWRRFTVGRAAFVRDGKRARLVSTLAINYYARPNYDLHNDVVYHAPRPSAHTTGITMETPLSDLTDPRESNRVCDHTHKLSVCRRPQKSRTT